MSNMLGSKIAEGGCSEVYEWEDQSKIIKLAKANTDGYAMRREFEHNLAAWKKGLPVARPYEFVEIADRPGIVFERINGETLRERLMRQMSMQSGHSQEFTGEDIRLTARLLSEIHSITDAELHTSQRVNIINNIHSVGYLLLVEKETVISKLEALPEKRVLCHGDPNPGNILVAKDGRPVIIDWMNASIGNPEADIAEYIIMFRYAVLPSDLPSQVIDFFDLNREKFIKIFMDEYTKLTGITYNEIEPWIIPIAARKLSADAISEDEKNDLLIAIRKSL